MQPELIIIDTPEGARALLSDLEDKDYIAYDCETTGLTRRDEIVGFSVCAELERAYYVVLSKWSKEEGRLIPVMGMLEPASGIIADLKNKQLIMHNGIFDAMMAEAYFKVSLIGSLHTDTMVLAHLLNENRRVGLKELASTMYGDSSVIEQKEMKESVQVNGGTLTKDAYEMYKADCYLLGKYGAKDAWLTFRLFHDLVPELIDQGLDKFFYDDESMPLLRTVTYELNTAGLKIDLSKLEYLKKTLEAECLEAKAFIAQEIAPHIQDKYPGTKKTNTFNIGASSQLAWLLFGKLGLEFSTLTKGGKTVCKDIGLKLPYTKWAKQAFITECERQKGRILKPGALVNGKTKGAKKLRDPWGYIACDKKTLKILAPKYEWIQKLLEYQRKTKILNTYVEGIQERTKYGVIQPSFLQHGTTSGRYSSRNPNFQNLPRDDKRIKAAIIARPGRVFVGADYSQLEPRVFAYFSRDERLLKAFEGEDDFYSVIGMEVYDKTDCTPRKEGSPDAFGVKYKSLRDLAKVIALASTYGATAHQLAPTTGKSIEDTAQDIENYFERFPGVRQMMLDSHAQAKKDGCVFNLFGRPRRMPEAKRITKIYGNADHADLPYEARKLLNLAVNHRIQSTGASIVNRAAIRFCQDKAKAGLDSKIVCQVHDSIIVECSTQDAEIIKDLLQTALENTISLEGVKLEAIPRIGRNFSEV